MDGLRWLLLFFGMLVVVGVYAYSRRQKAASEETPDTPSRRIEPILEQTDSTEVRESTEADEPEDVDGQADDIPQKIVTLRLVARNGGSFAGDELVLSMRGIGLAHGKFGIFHRLEGSGEDATVFSVASLIEPGSFDLTNIKEQSIPGVSLFLVLPGPLVGVEAFDMMMEAARALAMSLDGELLDESGSTLSIQRERYMREEIIKYEHSIKVA